MLVSGLNVINTGLPLAALDPISPKRTYLTARHPGSFFLHSSIPSYHGLTIIHSYA